MVFWNVTPFSSVHRVL